MPEFCSVDYVFVFTLLIYSALTTSNAEDIIFLFQNNSDQSKCGQKDIKGFSGVLKCLVSLCREVLLLCWSETSIQKLFRLLKISK